MCLYPMLDVGNLTPGTRKNALPLRTGYGHDIFVFHELKSALIPAAIETSIPILP